MAFPTDQIGTNPSASRRALLKWGRLRVGTAVLTTLPSGVTDRPTQSIKTLIFNADDISILNFALLIEELESAFYRTHLVSQSILKEMSKRLEFLSYDLFQQFNR